jgi:hypothetical protein
MNTNKNLVLNKKVNIDEHFEKLVKTVYNSDISDIKKIQIMKIIINKFDKLIDKFDKNKKIYNKYALLTGVNYIGSPYQLNGCLNDANNIKNILQIKKFSKITLLTDDCLNEAVPSKTNILNQFINLLTKSNEGDLLFFSYSGHGSYCLDKNNDELRGYDQTIIGCDLKSIKDDELKAIIEKYLKKGVTLFCLFDSCYSGSVLDLRYQYSDSLNENKLTVNTKEKETRGNVIMISGCHDEQTSIDALINGKYSGAMTAAFLYCCNKSQENLTWNKLLSGMRKYLKKNGYKQIPQLSSGIPIDINSSVWF